MLWNLALFRPNDAYGVGWIWGPRDARPTSGPLRVSVATSQHELRALMPCGLGARAGERAALVRDVLQGSLPHQLVQVAQAEAVVFPFLVEHGDETLLHGPAFGIRRPP